MTMKTKLSCLSACVLSLVALTLSSCANMNATNGANKSRTDYIERNSQSNTYGDYASRLPSHYDTNGRKVVLVDPNVHAWGAYGPSGSLEKAGLAVAGSDYCPDLGRRCHTKSGTFHVFSLGSASCKSSIFPMPHGGAPMPYCMFFNKNQALHGVHEGELAEANLSHGCVRMHIPDAEWLRFNFVNIGTTVVVRPY